MYLQYKMDYNFSKFKTIINLLKEDPQNPKAIEAELERLGNDDEVTKDLNIYQFVMILINQPMVYMQLLSTLVSMQLFGAIVTPLTKQEFKTLTFQDTVTLCSKNSPFVRETYLEDLNNEEIQNVAYNIYTSLIPAIVVTASADKKNSDLIPQLIEIIVNIADAVLGDGAGNKALVAAQTGVWGSAAAIQTYSKGCHTGGSSASAEHCAEADKLLDDLTRELPNLELE